MAAGGSSTGSSSGDRACGASARGGSGAPAGSPAVWRASARQRWAMDRPWIVGILNTTPDSFSDGGRFPDPAAAVEAGLAMLAGGAQGLDVGGESTRPGAAAVPAHEQVRRVVPVISGLRARLGPGDGAVITVDTTSARVARAALDAGADGVNDTSAGRDDGAMLALVAARGASVVLMHRPRPPSADAYSHAYGAAGAPAAPVYERGVVVHVAEFLSSRLAACEAAGIEPERVLVDPGLGFGKTVADNLRLIAGTGAFVALGRGVMSGLSRKSFVGAASVAGLLEAPPSAAPDVPPPAERLPGTLALSVAHLAAGARVFRVHDVPEHAAALRAAWAERAASTDWAHGAGLGPG